jgi:hypothetical protein
MRDPVISNIQQIRIANLCIMQLPGSQSDIRILTKIAIQISMHAF